MKNTQNQQTGDPLDQPLQLDYTPPGDRCIYCNADAYTCEHYEEDNHRIILTYAENSND